MTFVIADTDNIRESFVGAGTTAVTLGGAVSTSRPLSSKLSAANTAFMVARCPTTGDISVGEFTYNGATVTQTSVYYSSNANAAVSFPSGAACEIYLDIPSRWLEPLRYMNFATSVLSIGANQATNPLLKLDFSAASVATGLKITGAAAGGALALLVMSTGTNESVTFDAKGSGTLTVQGAATGNFVVGASKFTVAPGSGNTAIAGTLAVNDATEASSTTAASVMLAGGLGVVKKAFLGSDVTITGNFLPSVSGTPNIGSASLMFGNVFLKSGSVLNFNNGNYTATHSVGLLTLSGNLTTTGNSINTGTTTLSAALTYGGVTLSNAVTGTGSMVLSASPTFTGTVAASAITASGDLQLNWSGTNQLKLAVGSASNYEPFAINRTGNNTAIMAGFEYNGTRIGDISIAAGTATAFNTTSDERIKMKFGEDGIDWGDRIDQLWVGAFQMRASPGQWRLGIRAQQAYGIVPQGVTRPKSEDDLFMVDYSLALGPLAMWGVKDLRPRVKELEREIADIRQRLAA